MGPGQHRLPDDSVPAGGLAVRRHGAHLPAQDFDADNSTDILGFGEGLGTPGESTLPFAVPLVSSPKPGLAGTRLGIASVGIQLDVALFTLGPTEFSSGVTVVLP